MTEPRGSQNTPQGVIIHYEEPPTKPPPLLEQGILAWLRKNLFSSFTDTLLTIIGAIVIVGVVYSMVSWSVQSANWFAVNFNWRQFMLGRFESEYEWRIMILGWFTAATIGITLAAYARRIGFAAIIALIAVVLPIVAIPPLVQAFVPLEPSYLTAGNVPVVRGTSEEFPPSPLGFVAREGEDIRISLASDLSEDDMALSNLAGFADDAANNLRNGAIVRLESREQLAELESQIERDQAAIEAGEPLGVFTDNQRANLERQIESLRTEAETDPVTERYSLNEFPVRVQLLTQDFEPLGEAVILEPGSGDVANWTNLPYDGWYVLEKTIVGDEEAVALLAAEGIYPVFEGVSNYRRMTDNFRVTEQVPRIDNDPIAFNVIIDNQYWGNRPFDTYLRVYLGPFFSLMTPGLIQMVLIGAAAYIIIQAIDRAFSPREKPRKQSRRTANWMLITTPLLMFLLINGIGVAPLQFTDSRLWGGLLLSLIITVFGIIFGFPLGVGLALGRRSELPAIKYLCTFIIEVVRGTPFVVVLFAGQLLVPLIHPTFADIPNVYRALAATILFSSAYLAENVRGGLQSIPPGQTEAARALGLAGWQITMFITLPQALRAVIPALVGQFIGLFKDTSLLAIVGLIDLTGVVNSMVVQAEFIGTRREGLLFISIIYFILSYMMSYVSRRLEESGSGSARRI